MKLNSKPGLLTPAAIEAQAVQIGVLVKEAYKEDVYFRQLGDTSSVPTDRYRLRREGGRTIVTFKQSLSLDGVEVNEEVEFEVDDAHAFFQFTNRFGFEPFVVKRKKSRVYRVGRAHVELNEVEHLGHFVEIEILCDEEDQVAVARIEVARLLNQLGLSAEDLKPDYYIQMLQETHPVQYRFVNDRTLDWPFEEIN